MNLYDASGFGAFDGVPVDEFSAHPHAVLVPYLLPTCEKCIKKFEDKQKKRVITLIVISVTGNGLSNLLGLLHDIFG